MPKNIVAFGASNSRSSINKKLADFAANQVADANVNLLDLNVYEMPIYSIDKENANGIPALARQFKAQLKRADGIVISFAEHNGAYAAAFKNILDWISRIEKDFFYQKPMFLLATSPGGRGGQTVLGIATSAFSRWNQNTIASFSLPSFGINFSDEEGISDPVLLMQFKEQLKVFEAAL